MKRKEERFEEEPISSQDERAPRSERNEAEREFVNYK